MNRIMTLGEIVVEIMAAGRNQRFNTPGWLLGPYPSGAPAIFIDQVAKLGGDCAIVACVGDDDFGRLNVDRLAQDGVDTRHIHKLELETTGSAFVAYDGHGDRGFIYNIKNAACASLGPSLVDADVLADCALFHVTGSSLFSTRVIEAAQKAVDEVKSSGGRLSFDPNIRKEMLTDADMHDALHYIAERADILMPSEGEITALTEAENEADAIRERLAGGADEVIIKKGAAGCTYHDRDQTIEMPGLTIREVDPTGAGDCFAATYVALRQQGVEISAALRYANAAGANAACFQGPMEGTATRQHLDHVMRRYLGRPT